MKYFKSHSEFLNEAKLSAIHRAAKKGSYPVTLVVIENGKVIKQELVGTPAIVPAAFNILQEEYPKAIIHIEDRTGKRLFSESVVNEFGPMAGSGNRNYGSDDLVDRIGELDDILMYNRKAEREWEKISQNYLDDGFDAPYWSDLSDQELQAAINDAESLMKKYRIKESVNEAKFTKRSLMKAMKKDDGMIQLGNGQEYVIYNPNNGNDDNADMWQDKVIFGLDQDGEEHEIEYSDIVRYDESVVTENRDAKTIVKAFMKAYNKGEEVDAQDWEQFMYDWAVMRNGNDELEDEVSYDTMDDVLDMLYKKGYKKIDDEAIIKLYEATDLNDPVLVAYRATRKTLPKFKPAKAKSRRLSFDKYMDLLDARLDIDQQIKDLRDEMAQTLRDMEQEAEPEGGEIADEYGSTMMDQENEYTKLMAKKDKIMARIDKHRMA